MTSVSAPPLPPAAAAQRGAPRRRRAPTRQPVPRRRLGASGRFGTVQLVGLETAAALVGLAAASGSPILLVIAVVAASCLAAAVLLRFGGRWWYQLAALRVALRRRAHRAALSAASRHADLSDPGAWMLAPDLRVYSHDNRGDTIGIGQDRWGWFAAVILGGDTNVLSVPQQTLPLDRVLRLLDEGTARPSAVQVTTLRVPAPTTVLGDRAECVRSYVDLLGQVADPRPGAAQLTWLTVRLDPGDATAAAAGRGGGVAGVNRALAATVARIGKVLGAAEVDFHVLDADELRTAVDLGCGFDRPGRDGRDGSGVVEHWRGWHVDGMAHASFEVSRWPGVVDISLLDRLATGSADQTIVSLVVVAGERGLRVRTVVRIAAPPERAAAAAESITREAAGMGVELRALHGLHGPAAYASAPTGGGRL